MTKYFMVDCEETQKVAKLTNNVMGQRFSCNVNVFDKVLT